jgi:hypothetical protein
MASKWGLFNRGTSIVAKAMPAKFSVKIPHPQGKSGVASRTISGVEGDYLVFFPDLGELDVWAKEHFEEEFKKLKGGKVADETAELASALEDKNVAVQVTGGP